MKTFKQLTTLSLALSCLLSLSLGPRGPGALLPPCGPLGPLGLGAL